MKILGSNSWQGFTKTLSGDGAITITDKVARVSSGALTGVAQLEKRIDVRPGEVITLRVLARLKSGTRSRIALAYPTAGSPKSLDYITSRHWRHYSISMAVPHTHKVADFVNLILGDYNEDDGTVEFTELEIDVEGSGLAAARIHAAAKVKVLAGVPQYDPDYINHGITSMTLDLAATPHMLVLQLDTTFRDNAGFFPLPLVTHDGNLARQVRVTASMDGSGLGRVYVIFCDSAGALVNMSTIPSLAFSLAVLA